MGYLDPQPALPDHDRERKPGDAVGQPRRERDRPVAVPQAAEAGDERDPGAGQRCDVHSVAGVVLKVIQVHERGLTQVVECQVQMSPTSAAMTACVHADSDESRTVSAS